MNSNFPYQPQWFLNGDKIICIDKSNKSLYLNFGEIKTLPTKLIPFYGIEFDKPVKLIKK